MQNGREMQSTELEVRRRSEGYGCCRSSRSVSSTAAKRLSSTEFINHKNSRKKRVQGLNKELILGMTIEVNDWPMSRREGGASNNPAGAASA
jgi:hypothetical protein